MGPKYDEIIHSDLAGAYDESKSTVPILCFVAGNSEPNQSISCLSEAKMGNRNRAKFFTLGRGSVKHESCVKRRICVVMFHHIQDKNVYAFIRKCSDEGNWAVLQNMHLYPELVDDIVDKLQRDQQLFSPEFRLWMIGYSSSAYSARTLQYCTVLF